MKNFVINVNSFSKVTWSFQNNDMLLFRIATRKNVTNAYHRFLIVKKLSKELRKHIWTIPIIFFLKKWQLYLGPSIFLKTVIYISSSLIFLKNFVTCVIGLKTNELLIEVLKVFIRIAVKLFFVNVNSFTEVVWSLRNSDLQFFRFDIRQKC